MQRLPSLSPRLQETRPSRIHRLPIRVMDWYDLQTGQKHFLVFEEPPAGIHYGDILVMTCDTYPDAILVRWVRYAERGVGYAPHYVGVELAC